MDDHNQARRRTHESVERLTQHAQDEQLSTAPDPSHTSAITVESLSAHPELVAEVVEIAWREWGDALSDAEHARWLQEAERDCRLNTAFSAGFVAVDRGRAVGTVQLHEFDIDAMRDRSPWVCGMVVRPEYRGRHIGRRLLDALEQFAREHGIERVWVFTEHAAAFYEASGWERYGEAEQDGEAGVVLSKELNPSP